MDSRVLEGETTAQSSNAPSQAGQSSRAPRKRKNHRGGKKKRSRRKSFAISQDDVPHDEDTIQDPALDAARQEFYRMHGRSFSNTSIDSEVLLDHREQQPFIRPRRPSVAPNMSSSFQFTSSRLQTVQGGDSAGDDDEDDHFDEDAPLLSSSGRLKGDSAFATGGYGSSEHRRSRPQSQRDSSRSSSRRKHLRPFFPQSESYNVNYPPSVPGSPPMRPTERSGLNFGDALLRDEIAPEGSPRRLDSRGDLGESDHSPHISPIQRRHTIALQAEEDVCFPQEGLSELGDDEANVRDGAVYRGGRGRRRRGRWPDLGILDEWSRLEKEGRSDERRAKKITEPQLINGRLRPVHKGWYRAEEDAPYRFTYFNEEFQSTIHSQTISELVQPGGSFKELFLPDPPILSDSSDDEEEELGPDAALHYRSIDSLRNGETKVPTRQSSLLGQLHHNSETLKEGHMSPTKEGETSKTSQKTSGTATPGSVKSPATEKATLHEQPEKPEKPTRYGERPVWWLDVLSPTEAEMKVLSKAFGIHPLTAEDIMMQEAREKVELFRHYYLVNYRSFDQDQSSENFLEPVNVYVVVFREGVISFHFSMTPHPANVRRRVRQLRDYMILSADWISYAIIDDITDVFVPLIQNIEEEVDDIDDAILRLHSSSDPASSDHNKKDSEKRSDGAGESSSAPESGADMLRRVGDCRKKVMMLYRLLGNKADVIKGFAKRCNEHWEVAPRSEIGLYLGDIQDHIVTMTANLSHYEKILARSHGNYLAQINIRMNERQEQTADVLGRLTVLGTIVLPMNIITGLWGMNVWVPGQEWEGDLKWFWAITAGLLCFGLACYAIAKRVYKIV